MTLPSVGPSLPWVAATIRVLQKKIQTLEATSNLQPSRRLLVLEELITVNFGDANDDQTFVDAFPLKPPGVFFEIKNVDTTDLHYDNGHDKMYASASLVADVFENEDEVFSREIDASQNFSRATDDVPSLDTADGCFMNEPINVVARSKILSKEVFDFEHVPSPDNVVNVSTENVDGDDEQDATSNDASSSEILPAEFLDDSGEQYEHGDVETHAVNADTSDFSPHCDVADDDDYYANLAEHKFIESHGIEALDAWCLSSTPPCSSISTIVTTTPPISCASSSTRAPTLSSELACKVHLPVIMEDEPFEFAELCEALRNFTWKKYVFKLDIDERSVRSRSSWGSSYGSEDEDSFFTDDDSNGDQ